MVKKDWIEGGMEVSEGMEAVYWDMVVVVWVVGWERRWEGRCVEEKTEWRSGKF